MIKHPSYLHIVGTLQISWILKVMSTAQIVSKNSNRNSITLMLSDFLVPYMVDLASKNAIIWVSCSDMSRFAAWCQQSRTIHKEAIKAEDRKGCNCAVWWIKTDQNTFDWWAPTPTNKSASVHVNVQRQRERERERKKERKTFLK